MTPKDYLVQAYFQAFQDAAGQWRWRLRSINHRTIADSGEGYGERRSVLSAIARMHMAFGIETEEASLQVQWLGSDPRRSRR